MHHIESEAVKVAEKDGAGAQSEPENPVQVSTFFSELLTLSSKRGLISITAESKNSPRHIDLDASTPDASG